MFSFKISSTSIFPIFCNIRRKISSKSTISSGMPNIRWISLSLPSSRNEPLIHYIFYEWKRIITIITESMIRTDNSPGIFFIPIHVLFLLSNFPNTFNPPSPCQRRIIWLSSTFFTLWASTYYSSCIEEQTFLLKVFKIV